jgi:DNA-binding transcriptional regulator YdaS (Cro superfamily)
MHGTTKRPPRAELLAYMRGLKPLERKALAARCGTSVGHLNNVGYGSRRCSAALAVAVERESEGRVTRRHLVDGWERVWPDLARAA